MFCLATNQIAQTGLSSLPPVIYYSEQLFSVSRCLLLTKIRLNIDPSLPIRVSIVRVLSREGANKRGNSSRLTQSFHFFSLSRFFLP
ncbi:hypothetical protein EHZ61_21300 [Aeromonas caviae]|nr:hypothetical protein EHZ61_21300 [Aeromonas caviae]